jgi:hypothetical protein
MNKAGSASSQLGMQTEYMTQQQLEASAVAASLDQIHTKLTQTFTSEASAINNLTASYNKSIAAQALMTGGAIKRTRPTKKYASGVLSVPGPKGAGDVVPAMLSPGEAIIPAKQASKYSGFISSMISDNIPGFRFGMNPFASILGRSNVGVRMQSQAFSQALASGNKKYQSGFATGTGDDFLSKYGLKKPKQKKLRTNLEQNIFGLPGDTSGSKRPTYGFASSSPLQAILNTLLFGKTGARASGAMNPRSSKLDRYGDISLITKGSVAKRSSAYAGDILLDYSRNKNLSGSPAPMRGATRGQSQAAQFGRFEQPFGNIPTGGNSFTTNPKPPYIETYTPGGFAFKEIDKIIARNPTIAKQLRTELKEAGLGAVRVTGSNFAARLFKKIGIPGYKDGIFSVPGPKGAGDVVPSMLSPGEAVIPAKPAEKYASLIQSMIADNIPGFEKSNIKDKSGMVVKDVKLGSSTPSIPSTSAKSSDVKAYTNATMFLSEQDNQDLRAGKAGPEKLAASVRSGGALATSPLITEIVRAMGNPSQAEINKALKDPKLKKDLSSFATSFSSRLAAEVGSSKAPIGDAKFSEIAGKIAREEAALRGKDFAKATEKVLTRATTYEDNTTQRINEKGKPRARGRSQMLSGITSYRNQRESYKTTGAALGLSGTLPSKPFMAHITEPLKVSLAKFSGQLTATAEQSRKLLEAGKKIVYREGDASKKITVPSNTTAKESIAKLENETSKTNAKTVKQETKTVKAKAATVKVEKETQAGAKRADAARKGWETRRAKATAANQPIDTTTTKPRRTMGAGMAGMVASGAVMAGSMVPGQVGEISQQLMMPVMLLSMLAPMLSNPIMLAAAAIGGLAVAAFMLDQQFKENIKKSYELTTAMGAGSNAIRPLAESAGNVTAGEIMDKRRQGELSPLQIKPGKTTFGQTFVQSEAGQSLKATIGETAKELGREGTISKLVSQMATAVASQALSPQQARSVVAQLAQEMGDISLGVEVNAQLISLLGPNGENLLTSPLEIRTKLIEESASNISLGGARQRGGRGYITSKPVASAGQIGSFAANSVMALQQQKELVDSLQLEYEERIKNAKASGDLAKASELENKYQEDRQAILAQNATTVKKIQDQLSSVGNQRQVLDAFGNQIKAMFSENVSVSGMLPDLFNNLDKIDDKQEIILRAEILAGNIDPIALNNMLSDEALAPKVVPIIAQFGGTEANRIFQLAELMGKQESLDFLVNIKGMDVAEMDKYVTGLQKIYNLSAFTGQSEVIINAYVNSETLLDDFNTQMDALRKAAGDKPISTTMIQKLVTEGTVKQSVLDAIKSDQTYFDSLPKEQKLAYVQAITVSANLEGDQAVKSLFQAWQLQNGGKKNPFGTIVGGGTFADYLAQAIGKPVTEGGFDDTGKKNGGKLPGNNNGGGRKSNPLDNILKSLQNVRKASIDAMGGAKELLKLFEKGKNISVFKGIENQLLTLTSNTDFASFIAGLDKQEQKLFITIKNGNVKLKEQGRLLEKAFQAKTIGDFVLSQQKLTVSSKNELTARNLLIKAGYSYAESVDMARDSEIQLAFAQARATPKLKDREKAIKAVEEALKSGLAAQKATLTAEEQFDDLYDKIQGKLDAGKTAIELKFKIDTAADDKIIRDAENKIAGIQYRLDDQEAGLTLISDKEDVINEKYDKRLEALDKIKSVNDSIAQQQKNQLSLADALSSGDIGAAAAAMQQIQQDYVSGSSAKQQDLIEKARQQELLRVSVLVNGELRTREQIEKTIKDLQKEIFEIEESRLEPAQENNRVLIAARDEALLKLDQESDKWLTVRNSIDLAKTAALDYGKELAAANALAVTAVSEIKNPPPATSTPAVTPAANTPAANTPPKEKALNLSDMARRVYRGEYGNGQARTNKLMAEGYTKAQVNKIQDEVNKRYYANGGMVSGYALGGMVGKYMADGGFPGMPKRGTDTIPAMLTPGEFVIRKQAVQNFGVDNLKSINSGASLNDSVYNYSVNVNVKTDADASQIAKTVMTQIKQIDSQRIRGVGLR